MRKTLFFKNAAIITVNTLLLRLAGVIFRVWTAANIGSEGMGLYQLTLSVYVLCSTFASTGIATTVSRLVSDKQAQGDLASGKAYTKKAAMLCMVVCCIFIPILYFKADFISNVFLNEARTAQSIRLCGFALPFVSLCACFRGYFIAKRKTFIPCLSQLIEQTVRIITVIFFINKATGIEQKISALIIGDIAAEALSCAFLFLFWKKEKIFKKGKASYKEILRIALPISGGKYINSFLRTIENILVPSKLAVFYASKSTALSAFGIIKGMALPILLFPYALLGAATSLLLPEISADASLHHTRHIRYTTERALKLTFIFSFFCAIIFLFTADTLGQLIYQSHPAGKIIKILAPLVPVMYIDSISDAILKSLDKQIITFKTSISDSIIRLVLIYFCLTSGGVGAFVIIMYISNLYTSGINFYKMYKYANLKISFMRVIFMPLAFSFFAGFITKTLLLVLNLKNLVYFIFFFLISLIIYLVLLFIFKILSKEDIKIK